MLTNRNAFIGLSLLVCILIPRGSFSEAEPIQTLLPKNLPKEWVLRDAPEMFTKQTLFEHIDGQADLFLQYGFEKSIFAIYRNIDSSDNKIDVDIYEMGNVLQAFGIFSRFRNEDRPAGIGLDSSVGDHYAFFYKGKYFVVIQATESNPFPLKQLAESIESGILDNSHPPEEIRYFPKNGLKPGSIEYFPDGLLGHQFLGRGFKATYIEKDSANAKDDSETASRDCYIFVAIFNNSQESMRSLKLYHEDLSRKGACRMATSVEFGPNTLTGEDPYHGKVIIAHKGPYLAGAVGFEKEKHGENQLSQLIKEIK
jgi:hypothetical protein